jgi:NADPH:quinone reductase-like Zn-dependent oxidoreductase
MSHDVPTHALQLRTRVTEDGKVELSLEEVEVPDPGPNQLLIRMEAAPINPSDMGLLFAGADPAAFTAGSSGGQPTASAPLPPAAARANRARVGQSLPAGNEGAGTVVAAAAGLEDTVGRTVAAAGGAAYGQYSVADAGLCMVLPEGVSAAEGSASFVNPMTALGMIETMRSEGHTAIVHTAAASNLGQMLQKACLAEGIALVNIVRSPAQRTILEEIGAQHVCDSSSESFMSDLIAAVKATGATIGFDAIGGGSTTSRILTAMEAAAAAEAPFNRYGSNTFKQVYIYGGLDTGPTELTRGFGFSWGVGGWLLTPFLMKVGAAKIATMREQVTAGITTTFASRFTDRVSLAGALDPAAIATYGRRATGQKYLIEPQA